MHEVVELPGLRTALFFLSRRNAVSRPPWKTVSIQVYDGRSLGFPKTQLRARAGPSVTELKDNLKCGVLRAYRKVDLTNPYADFIWYFTPVFQGSTSSRCVNVFVAQNFKFQKKEKIKQSNKPQNKKEVLKAPEPWPQNFRKETEAHGEISPFCMWRWL